MSYDPTSTADRLNVFFGGETDSDKIERLEKQIAELRADTEVEAAPVTAGEPDLIIQLLNHIEDVVDDKNWKKIDGKLWTQVARNADLARAALAGRGTVGEPLGYVSQSALDALAEYTKQDVPNSIRLYNTKELGRLEVPVYLHPTPVSDVGLPVQASIDTPDMLPLADWQEFERISDLPDVDESLRGFSEDPTADNAICVVRSIIHAHAAPQVAEKVVAGGLVPDAACKQGKCAMPTTGCWGKCYMENPGFVIPTKETTS